MNMRRRWIGIGVTAAGALLLVQYLPHSPRNGPKNPITLLPPPARTNLLVRPDPAAALPELEYLTYTDRLLLMIDPLWFEHYQGSYTLQELREESGSSSLTLNSAWLLRRSAYPQLGIMLEKEPGTDTYRMSGGEVFLPGSGVGISYEEDADTGESRAFLKLKREF